MKKVLLVFRHGLGDAAQLTIVLKHLTKYRPDWIVDIEALIGKHTIFGNLCNKTFIKGSAPRSEYEKVMEIRWMESFLYIPYTHVPITKVTKSLRDEFKIDPDPRLFYYEIQITDKSHQSAKNYIDKLPKQKIAIVHFQGNTGSKAKNVDENTMCKICDFLTQQGFIIIILDWDRRRASHLANANNIFCPGEENPLWGGTGTGDGNVLAALIDQSNLFIGIDSGPLHIAGATKTPTIGLWTGHHPLHYFDLSNVKHLIPMDARNLIQSKKKNEHENYFHENYKHHYYADLADATIDEIISSFDLPMKKNQPDFEICANGHWWQIGSRIETATII